MAELMHGAEAARGRLIALGAAQWRDPNSEVRRTARQALASGEWSMEVIEAALGDVLYDLDESTARALLERTSGEGVPTLVLLPGNVIGPAVAAAYCAAIARAPAVLKASSTERRLAEVVAWQFDALGPPLAGTIAARWWRGGDLEIEAAEFAQVRKVVAFGADETIADVRRRAPPTTRVVGYGDAYSIGFVRAGSAFELAADSAARDVCLFDQRGCMSPQSIYVEGDDSDALRFAHCLARTLEHSGSALPRARPAEGEAAVAAAALRRLYVSALPERTHGLDAVIVGRQRNGCPDFLVAALPEGPPSCFGFGRIVVAKPVRDARRLAEIIKAEPLSIDTVGVAGDLADDDRLALCRAGASRVCALGEMQRPPFGYRPRPVDFAWEPA